MSDPVVVHERPLLAAPVAVVALEGWIDAGLAAAAAAQALLNDLEARPIATFDADRFLDYRARRPVMHLREGVNTGLTWPGIELRAGRDQDGNDVLLLVGYEPDAAWREFAARAVALFSDFGVRMMVGFGAYPFARPHTRPSRLTITTTSQELADTLPYGRNSADVPAGMQAVLEAYCRDADIPAVTLWAQVPHYAAGMPYPPAAVALLEAFSSLAGVAVPAKALRDTARAHLARLDALVAQSTEHTALVRQLEAQVDAQEAGDPFDLSNLPSGDELAAELERYLRENPEA